MSPDLADWGGGVDDEEPDRDEQSSPDADRNDSTYPECVDCGRQHWDVFTDRVPYTAPLCARCYLEREGCL